MNLYLYIVYVRAVMDFNCWVSDTYIYTCNVVHVRAVLMTGCLILIYIYTCKVVHVRAVEDFNDWVSDTYIYTPVR